MDSLTLMGIFAYGASLQRHLNGKQLTPNDRHLLWFDACSDIDIVFKLRTLFSLKAVIYARLCGAIVSVFTSTGVYVGLSLYLLPSLQFPDS